jgi:hypothetical protein
MTTDCCATDVTWVMHTRPSCSAWPSMKISRAPLGSALRALDERIALAKKLHQDAERSGYPSMAEVWERKLRDFEREAELLRTSLRRLDEISARSANNTNA